MSNAINMLNIILLINSTTLTVMFLVVFKNSSVAGLLMCVELCWASIVLAASLFSIYFGSIYFLYFGLLTLCLSTVELALCLALYYIFLR